MLELGRASGAAGWDGFFVWDHVAYREPEAPVADPWVAISAVAATTERMVDAARERIAAGPPRPESS